jgi:hypothetical protein
MYRTTEWWVLYSAAILETNPAAVGKRATAARDAIEKRLLAGQLSQQENAAIHDAKRALETLAVEPGAE